MTTAKQARHSHFQRGSGVFNCTSCGRSTRVTTQDNDKICAECWDLAGEVNCLSDNGETYESPANVRAIFDRCVERGGSVELLLRDYADVAEFVGWPVKAEAEEAPVAAESAIKLGKQEGPELLTNRQLIDAIWLKGKIAMPVAMNGNVCHIIIEKTDLVEELKTLDPDAIASWAFYGELRPGVRKLDIA